MGVIRLIFTLSYLNFLSYFLPGHPHLFFNSTNFPKKILLTSLIKSFSLFFIHIQIFLKLQNTVYLLPKFHHHISTLILRLFFPLRYLPNKGIINNQTLNINLMLFSTRRTLNFIPPLFHPSQTTITYSVSTR